jgi:acylphosphatase
VAETRRLAIEVIGRVQGVGFRYFTSDLAKRLSLTGWVRNTTEGSVSIEAQGDASTLALFETELHDGPPLARVRNLQVTSIPLVIEDCLFEIRF